MQTRITLIILIISLCNLSILSAQKLYTDVDIGFGIGIGKQNFDGFFDYRYCDEVISYDQKSLSFGQGFNLGGSLGYMFTENIGVEAGFVSFFGGFIPSSDHSAQDCRPEGDTIICSCINAKHEYYVVNLYGYTTSFVLSTDYKGVKLYTKFGLIAVHGKIEYGYTTYYSGERRWKFTGGLSLGIDASAGVNVSLLQDKISVFGELNTVNVSYVPAKGKMTEALDIEGNNLLPNMTPSEKEIKFVDNYSYDEDYTHPDSEPRKELKKHYPFSTFGLKLGFKYMLTK